MIAASRLRLDHDVTGVDLAVLARPLTASLVIVALADGLAMLVQHSGSRQFSPPQRAERQHHHLYQSPSQGSRLREGEGKELATRCDETSTGHLKKEWDK